MGTQPAGAVTCWCGERGMGQRHRVKLVWDWSRNWFREKP